MKWSEQSEKWVEEYVSAVVAASGAKTDEEKEEWARGVRERVMEAASEMVEEASISDEGMAELLGNMEAPEAYAGGEGSEGKKWRDAGGGGMAKSLRRGERWAGVKDWLVQFAGAALVAVASVFCWEAAGCGARSEESGARSEESGVRSEESAGGEASVAEAGVQGEEGDKGTGSAVPAKKKRAKKEAKAPERRLQLVDVRQADLGEDNNVTVVFAFDHEVEWAELSRRLKLTDGNSGKPLGFKSAPRDDWWWNSDWEGGNWTARVRTDPLSGNSLRWELAPGLTGKGMKEKEAMAAATNGTLKVENDLASAKIEAINEGLGGRFIAITFPLRVDPEDVLEHLEIDPPTAVAETEGTPWGSVRLRGAFERGKEYEVTLKAGLAAACGVTLTNDVTATVTVPDGSRDLATVDGRSEMLLSTKGSRTLALRMYGYDGAAVSMRPVREGSLVEWAAHHNVHEWSWGGISEWAGDVTRPATTATNWAGGGEEERWTERVVKIDLGEAASPRELGGLYRVELYGVSRFEKENGEEYVQSWRERHIMLNVTDIGLHAQWWTNEMAVMANSLRTGRPLAGLEVNLWGRGREVLASGTTDEAGLVHLQWTPEDAEEHGAPVLVTAKTAEDLGYLSIPGPDSEQVVAPETRYVDFYMESGAEEAYAWTDRGIYRHGETMRVQALLRGADGRAPEPHPVKLELRHGEDRGGTPAWSQTAMPDETGAVQCDVDVREEWKTGRYRLRVTTPDGSAGELGGADVMVEDFVPPQIRVDATKGGAATDGVARVKVRASYLFGKEAANLPYEVTWSWRAAPFAPEGWAGWTFGDANKEFTRKLRKVDESRLDSNGEALLERAAEPGWAPPARLSATCEVSVRDESGRAVRGWTEVPVDPYPRYVGLKEGWGEGLAEAGTELSVQVAQLKPDGTPDAEARPLVMKLERLTWVTAARRDRDGHYEWVNHAVRTTVKEGTVEGGAETREWRFAADEACEYEVTARDPETGSSASLRFEATGAAEAKGARKRTAGELELEWVHRGEAKPGGTAKLRIKPPFAGWAAVTLGDRHLRWTKGLDVPEEGVTVDVPVPEGGTDDNYVATVLMVRPVVGEKFWSAHRARASAALRVARPEKELNVTLTAPKTARPQKKMTVKVRVKGGDGQAAAGVKCSVAAVDEGICMLTDFQSPEPAKTLRRNRRARQEWRDDYGTLMIESDLSADGETATGGDGRGFLRNRLNPIRARRYKPTALWSGVLETDEKGVAAVSFDLPEFSGELRIMAVAWDAARTGAAETRSAVRRDVVVQPSFPRFLGTGDEARIPVPAHNTTAEKQVVRARLACAGAVSTDVGEQEAELGPGESRTLWFTLRAAEGRAGVGTCHLAVTAGGETYAEDVELAVRPLGATQTRFEAAMLGPDESARWEAPEGWVPESVAADVRMSTLPGLDAAGAWEYVATYPYGCLEQTISGALPLVTGEEWIREFGSKRTSAALADPKAWVRRAIARVQLMQTRNGGFAMWPGWTEAGTDASAYAVEFLTAAKAAGYEVDPGVLNRAKGWVNEVFRRGRCANQTPAEWRWERLLACRAGMQLGMTGDWVLNELDDESAFMDGLERALLASAMLEAGKPERAAALLEGVDVSAEGLGGHGRGVMDSPVRGAALLLSAWLDLDEKAPEVGLLLGALRGMRGPRGHWGNTQANAMALYALGKAAAHLPRTEQPFRAVAEAGGRKAKMKGRTDSAAWAPGAASGGVDVCNEGPGTATAVVRFEGVSGEPEAAGGHGGMEVSRRFVDLDGRELDASSLEQGTLFTAVVTVKSERGRDNVVVEELLPAGWEVENPNLLTSTTTTWQPPEGRRGHSGHREIRDDRLLLFVDVFAGETDFAYTVRAVTPGRYALPGTVAECMYKPEVRAVGERGEIEVRGEESGVRSQE
ncbi:MAG: hypothetical protein IK066_10770 [Kiritimatiellae bacterium]|nr:hypothetical protein [Kiritimatiellia bacterium]